MPSSLMARLKATQSSGASSTAAVGVTAVRPTTTATEASTTPASILSPRSNHASAKSASIPIKDISSTMRSPKSNPEPVKILEQLLRNDIQNGVSFASPMFPPPPPFYMCSESEALDRQQHFELSPFECNPSSLTRAGMSTFVKAGPSPAQSGGMQCTNAIPKIKETKPLESSRPKSSLAAAKSSLAAAASGSFTPTPNTPYYAKQNSNNTAEPSSFTSPSKATTIPATLPSNAAATTPAKTAPFTPTTPYTAAISTPATTGTALRAARANRPTANSHYVVKKYRRSAAGGGTLSEISEKSVRTLEQLNGTVDYLLMNILVWQMPPPVIGDVGHAGNAVNTNGGAAGNSGYHSNGYSSGYSSDVSSWGEDTLESPSLLNMQQQEHLPFSLCDTVAFIDDRLRAVQKDLVTLLGNFEESADISFGDYDSRQQQQQQQHLHQPLQQNEIKYIVRGMQARMVRYSILSSYLLSDVPPSKYEVKFGARALRTSLTCYLNLSLSLQEEFSASGNKLQYDKECQTKDEMMAYMALLHSSAVLRSEEPALPPPSLGEITSALMEESGSGWGALLSTFSKHVLMVEGKDGKGDERGSLVEKYPRWKWALELACVAQEGNYQRYFKLLERGPEILDTTIAQADNARFLILARCCTSHSLNLIRVSALRRFNHSFGKGEKVSGLDLATLLRFGTNDEHGEDGAKRALDFCRDVGVPIIEKDEEGAKKESFAVMKSAPILISGDEPIGRICNPGRSNDFFVFDSNFVLSKSPEVTALENKLQQCDIKDDEVDDWEERDGDNNCVGMENNFPSVVNNVENDIMSGARVDEDGVLIPNPGVMWNLLQCFY